MHEVEHDAAEQDVLRAMRVLRADVSPVTATAVGSYLGMDAELARAHLRALKRAGLVQRVSRHGLTEWTLP